MFTRFGLLIFVGTVLCVCSTDAWAVVDGKDAGDHATAEHPTPPPSSPLLEPLRNLEGTWEGTPTEQHEGMPDKYTSAYRTTAGGSAVVETIFPGTDYEMVSVYYADGDKIVMTHYCMLGNQPTMTAKPSADGKTLDFVCQGGGNLPSEDVPHMHGATYRFIDNDHMQVMGTSRGLGQGEQCGTVDYHRVSPARTAASER